MSSGNLLFLFVMLLGPLVSISSSNWVICWVGLELSFLGAIPLLLSDSGFMSLSKESVIKYFCIQALGSGLLMLGGVMYFMDPMIFEFSEMILIFSLFIKLGVFPMHFWVPGIASGLNWFALFILLGWQKIPPFALLINLCENSYSLGYVVMVIGGISALVGALIGLNQTNLRAMLGGSSIAHTGWSCVGVVCGGLWTYFLLYMASFLLLMIFVMVKDDFMMGLMILGLSGLPPFVMFIGKWSILKSVLIEGYSFFFLTLPILSALLSLFFYLKFFYSFYLSSAIFNSSKSKYSYICSTILLSVSGVMYVMLF
uniref:NADH-ubiquinone oxidoreductase chain 2 n=1 Tax=Ceratodoris hiroi TaxID=1505000 RepID=A0A888YRT5_9GAST|nr:NADH dehydrogenase subunit 2 [Ceratodoris hiroi]QRC77961.1 NADH dehydrogenase subunit 2 [Ceratodoris hiroi]